MKVREWSKEPGTYIIWCPGCGCHHYIPALINQPKIDKHWQYNGDVNNPTFTPSVKITAQPTAYCCHFNITNGQMIFHGDCNQMTTHNLVGVTVPLPEIPENENSQYYL